MSESTALEGGCLCGAIRYRIEGAPRHVSHCHCEMCRRAGGAPMVTWATVGEAAFKITRGEPRWYRSSDHARRGFCGACGTPLLFVSTRYPGSLDVTAGSLDRPMAVTPTHHTFEPERIAWMRMADGLPRHRGDSASPLI